MHMLLARSAIERGMQRVAGMLTIISAQELKRTTAPDPRFELVSWRTEARSRREDELARIRETPND